MSWYSTVILSFGSHEFEDEKNPARQTCAPLRTINARLKKIGYEPLTNLNPYRRGKLASNVVLFGVTGDGLDVTAFCEHVAAQPWQTPDDVQVLFWDDNDSKFAVIEFRERRARGRRDGNTKKRRARSGKNRGTQNHDSPRRRPRHPRR